MIKKAQIKFVCIVMAIFLAVFGVIFGVSYFILQDMNERAIIYNLSQMEKNYKLSEGETIPYNGFIVSIEKQTDNSYIKYPHFNEDSFSADTVEKISNIAMEQPNTTGTHNNIYYRISSEGENYLLVAADVTDSLLTLRATVINTLTALLLIYLCLCLIVWLLSYSVFQPIQESLYKQKQFISNASHELKTPLTIISANADVLNQGNTNPYLNNIKSQTARLNDLVTDMLTLAKLDEGTTPIVAYEFNLSEEILNNTLPFDAVAFEKGKELNFEIDPDIIYKGDIQSVKKITNILLDNAIKHASPDGKINVSLKKENSRIIFAVSNSGSEISSKDANKIFERFYRGDASRSRDSGGSGLGLSIAKNIADANKWKIYAHSKLHESMTIFVIF